MHVPATSFLEKEDWKQRLLSSDKVEAPEKEWIFYPSIDEKCYGNDLCTEDDRKQLSPMQ